MSGTRYLEGPRPRLFGHRGASGVMPENTLDAFELGWKLVDGYRLLLKLGFYAAFARPRRAHVAMILRGIRDGVRGRLGQYKT